MVLGCVLWRRFVSRAIELLLLLLSCASQNCLWERLLSFIKVVGIMVALITIFYCYLAIVQ